MSAQLQPPKPPRPVFDTVFAFPPNRDTQGGTAYFIVDNSPLQPQGNLLIDAPPWSQTTQDFLAARGGVRWWFITHRGGLGQAARIQKALNCELVIQEQEAYLLPGTPTTTFHQDFCFNSQTEALWTPGHSPGSACLYHRNYGGVLFTGRHLLPNSRGKSSPYAWLKPSTGPVNWPRLRRSSNALGKRTWPISAPPPTWGFSGGN
ncbi:MAG: MBL fold metallo-hydrolase [Nodosilinea sp. LVE1205-7]|jgi:glyoxylase-like metal-dependent hydrolase (beta-lactamase superfamily II)